MLMRLPVALIKVMGEFKKSSEIMKLMNRSMNLPEIAKDMQHLAAEMMKAGIIDEMVEEALESVEEDELEELAEQEVNKLLHEVAGGIQIVSTYLFLLTRS